MRDGLALSALLLFATAVLVGAVADDRPYGASLREARAKVVADGEVIAEVIHHVRDIDVTVLDLAVTPWAEVNGPALLSPGALNRVADAALAGTTTALYLHSDPQGTVTMVTDALKGDVIERRSYEPFGRLRSPDWVAGQQAPAVGRRNVGYTGHVEDEETGLISMVGRMYSPQLGRFLTSDPFVQAALNTQSHNRYSYVWNNPVTMTDPTGFEAEGEEEEVTVFRTTLDIENGSTIVVDLPDQPAEIAAATPASTDAPPAEGPVVEKPTPRRDPVFVERPRLRPHSPSGLWDSYRELIGRANAAVSHAGHRAGDIVQDVTGSATLAAMVATNVHLLGGIPVGLAGLGLLPEQLIDSVDVFDDGLEQLAVGLEQQNPYIAARGGAQLAGVVGMWAGTAAGAASVVKAAPSALARTTRAGPKIPRGLCFTAGTQIATEGASVRIQDLRVGDRVRTYGEVQSSETAVDPATWRLVRLEMPNPDGSEDVLEIELLRPVSWVAEHRASVGMKIHFVLEEMGLEGPAKVVGIEGCPTIEPGEGRVVLATVTHLNGEVLEVRFDGSDTVLEPTSRHRLFSARRQQWIPAGELVVGEELVTSRGQARIASIRGKPGIHRVYNLEVETEHSFLASDLEVLSHNENPCAHTAKGGGPQAGPPASTPVGRVGRGPMKVQPGTNIPERIGGRDYTGHAIDRMQQRGLVPSVVEDAITNGNATPGRVGGTTAHYSSSNNVTVITETATGRVITTYPGIGKGF